MNDWLTQDAARWLTGALAQWLPTMRWYGEKSRAIDSVDISYRLPLRQEEPSLDLLVVEVRTQTTTEHYQVLIATRADDLPEHLGAHRIGDWAGRTVHEALADPQFAALLGGFFGVREEFRLEPGVDFTPGSARLLTAEQSNSSIVFGSAAILKIFRKLTAGPNRDVELHRALRVSSHIAEPWGAIMVTIDATDYVLGLLQRFLPDAVDGWEMATTSVRDLMAEGDLHAREVGGDFAAEAQRLGAAVAAVHADLATVPGAGTTALGTVIAGMRERLDAMAERVAALRPHVDGARAVFDAAEEAATVAVQHIHGDLHLGQVLRTTTGWVLIDFEGEPAAAPEDRIRPRSTLVDVAGMLRSFDYAAHQPIAHAESEEKQLVARAREWAVRNIDAFCQGYASVAADPRTDPLLLKAFELDKAIYEVGYEYDNRPTWLAIPLGAVARLTAGGH